MGEPRRIRLVCLGLSALDMTWSVDLLPHGGSKTRAFGMREEGGGMAANAAVTAARLGASVSLWARAGDDPAGRRMRDELLAFGVDVSGFRLIPDARSSVSGIVVGRDGERMIVNFRGEGLDDDPAWLPLDQVGQAGAVLADPRWPEGAAALFSAAHAVRVPTVLDADRADVAVFERLLPLADYAVFSEQGLSDCVGPGRDVPAALGRARAMGCRLAGVTRGAHGVTWLDGVGLHQVPAFPVEVRDTT
ncbi:MAG: PfkB family carbohydrate kinase, partial [Lautropia sp.]